MQKRRLPCKKIAAPASIETADLVNGLLSALYTGAV
jgi:hypothetical protein